MITDYQASYLWKQIAKKGWRTKEPYDEELFIEEPSLLKEAIQLLINLKSKSQLCRNKPEQNGYYKSSQPTKGLF